MTRITQVAKRIEVSGPVYQGRWTGATVINIDTVDELTVNNTIPLIAGSSIQFSLSAGEFSQDPINITLQPGSTAKAIVIFNLIAS
jgi:hypothetical protein